MLIKKIGLAGLALGLTPLNAFAETAELNSGNTAWILTSTALVLFMTLPGLALFYGGLVHRKNVLSILMQSFVITCIVSLLWVLGLYSMAFTEGNDFVGGMSKAFMVGIGTASMQGDIPENIFSMFQLTFAIITPALIIGAFAERIKFSALLIFTVCWVILVYAPVTHWVWGGGWLQKMGLLDFAGGTVVHITAGIAALVAALVIGPRRNFPKTTPPHNMTMTLTGAGMLWVGWFGFNGGSALAANGSAGMAIMVTHISASAGALAWMTIEWVKYGKPSALGIATGMVAGLGTITPASGFVGPMGGMAIGLIAGVVCFYMTHLIKAKLKIDDSLDVFPVHGVGGIIGTFMAGIFASPALGVFSGLGFAEGISSIGGQLYVQTIGILATGAYTAVITYVLFKVIDKITGLRVDEETEIAGLDLREHEERGYIF